MSTWHPLPTMTTSLQQEPGTTTCYTRQNLLSRLSTIFWNNQSLYRYDSHCSIQSVLKIRGRTLPPSRWPSTRLFSPFRYLFCNRKCTIIETSDLHVHSSQWHVTTRCTRCCFCLRVPTTITLRSPPIMKTSVFGCIGYKNFAKVSILVKEFLQTRLCLDIHDVSQSKRWHTLNKHHRTIPFQSEHLEYSACQQALANWPCWCSC